MATLLGVDVSYAQGTCNFDRVAADGCAFVFAKCTDGHTYRDPFYSANRKAIPDAGLVPGAYHYLEPLNGAPISQQADWFVDNADPNAIHALDVEAPGPLDPFGWVKRYRVHYPTKPLMIYTNPGLWRQRAEVPQTEAASLGLCWAAGIGNGVYVPGAGTAAQQRVKIPAAAPGLPWLGWTGYTFMQFTDSARVDGISSNVDANLFNGTPSQLQVLAGDDMALSADDKTWIQGQLKAFGWGAVFGKAPNTHTAGEMHSTTWRAATEQPTPESIADAVVAKLAAGITVAGGVTPADVRQALVDVLSSAKITAQV